MMTGSSVCPTNGTRSEPMASGGPGGIDNGRAIAQVEERELLKAMSWWDGFMIALANPGFLIAALGGSIASLGTTGALVLWLVSVVIGSLQNNIYAELATMFPEKSGGISVYAHEAWRRYFSPIGAHWRRSATGSRGPRSCPSVA
jgi:hypothetical protein